MPPRTVGTEDDQLRKGGEEEEIEAVEPVGDEASGDIDNEDDNDTEEAIKRTGIAIAAEATVAAAAVTVPPGPGDDLEGRVIRAVDVDEDDDKDDLTKIPA